MLGLNGQICPFDPSGPATREPPGCVRWNGVMQLLVLGGTAFLSAEVVRRALAAGHDVTSAARGSAGGFVDGAEVVTIDRDRPDGLEPLVERRWDAVVDVSRQPGQVRRAAAAFAGTGVHYVFVSTGNVYADMATHGQDEDAPLLDPLDGDVMADMSQYGPAKVACESALRAAFPAERLTIARSGLIGGTGDSSGRSGYWPWRFAHPTGDDVLVPDEPEQPISVIDVADLADWLVRCATDRTAGIFNAFGDVLRLGDVLDLVAAGSRAGIVRAAPGWLAGQGANAWMGERSLPLWVGDRDIWGFLTHRNDRAKGAGLALRPVADTLAAAGATYDPREARAGLTDDEESELLRALAGGTADD
jgi:2'-hydroxyisoflavone reductase